MTLPEFVATVLIGTFVASIALAAIQLKTYYSIKKIDEELDETNS